MHRVLLEIFVRINLIRSSKWVWPSIRDLIEELPKEIWRFPTNTGRTVANNINAHRTEIRGVIFYRLPTVLPTDDQNKLILIHGYRNTATNAKAIRLYVRAFRLRGAQGMFRLPNGKPVAGPYFAATARDIYRDAIVRLRVWPLWLAPDRVGFALVASNLERKILDEVYAVGRICFVPSIVSQLGELQEQLGHRWRGTLVNWDYRSDGIIFPLRYAFLHVYELFGLRGFKKYYVGKRTKCAAGKDAQTSGEFRFTALEISRATKSCIKAVIEKLGL